jgi:hypothetical protein
LLLQSTPLSAAHGPPPPPQESDSEEEEEYAIARILAHKYEQGKLWFYTHFVESDEYPDEWLDAECFESGGLTAVHKYVSDHRTKMSMDDKVRALARALALICWRGQNDYADYVEISNAKSYNALKSAKQRTGSSSSKRRPSIVNQWLYGTWSNFTPGEMYGEVRSRGLHRKVQQSEKVFD